MKVILTSALLAGLLFTGCTEDKKVVEEVKKEEVKIVVPKVEVKKVEIKEETSTEVVSKATSEVAQTVTKAVKEISTTISDATTKVVEKNMPVVKKAIADVSKKIDEVTSKPTINVKALFAACASCHGANGEKAALGKSQVIKGWDKEKVITALNGYKDGSYGGAMKGIMKGQVMTKSKEEIEALATFISNL